MGYTPKEGAGIINGRRIEYPVGVMFVNRWSGRAMSGAEIRDDQLMSLLEAARWAPSCNNKQPWMFLYSKRGSGTWETFISLLNENNQLWAVNAAVLLVLLSRKREADGTILASHSFDAGAAWENLSLEASMRGLVSHAIGGFDHEKARAQLKVPDDFEIEAMIAVGKPGNVAELPADLQRTEFPSPRKSISEIAREGRFE